MWRERGAYEELGGAKVGDHLSDRSERRLARPVQIHSQQRLAGDQTQQGKMPEPQPEPRPEPEPEPEPEPRPATEQGVSGHRRGWVLTARRRP